MPGVILIGLPGSGKTTVGRQLAKRLAVTFIDSDYVLEQRLGCSIKDYFARHDELAFRDIEERVLDELSADLSDKVLSTGGGAVLRPVNRRHLRERGKVIYLKSTPDELFRRLRHDVNRPLLQVPDPLGRLRELFVARDPLYRETAHFVIETGRPSVSTLVNMIVMQLELSGSVVAPLE